jgi:predicted aspartyl protease
MASYDGTRFDPPAPVALVTLRHPESERAVSDVLMLVDTGADVSLVPRNAVAALALSSESDIQYRLVGFDGSVQSSSVVHLELILGKRKFRGQFLLIDQETGILGRNILNQLPLLLDGPGLRWHMHKPAADRGDQALR